MLKSFFKGVAKVAAAIVLAALVLTAIGYGFTEVREANRRREAAPLEEVKVWTPALHPTLAMKLRARTKVVDGFPHADLNFDGYPPYLAQPINSSRQLTVEFRDKDGFKLFEKALPIQNSTTIVGPDGKPSGLQFEFSQMIALEEYRRWSTVQVGWNLDTTMPTAEPWKAYEDPKPKEDHCAPGLSKAERLKRLAQYGIVRETGAGDYSAGSRSVSFLYDGSLAYCR